MGKVKTNDLDATYVVTGREGRITVTATLLQNFHTTVDLVEGDVLVATSGDEETTLSGSGHYNGSLDVAPDPGTEITVSLDRSVRTTRPARRRRCPTRSRS